MMPDALFRGNGIVNEAPKTASKAPPRKLASLLTIRALEDVWGSVGLLLIVLGALRGAGAAGAEPQQEGPAPRPTNTYWVYVGAESADLIHRIRFGPDGAVVERTTPIGELPNEMEGPHGLAISPDGKYLYMTTGHGRPDGKLWKYELGADADTLVGEGLSLGFFPASLDVTLDGLYSLSVNFNLHGDMVPSTVSVVYTPTSTEVARIVTCTMPHGSRIDPGGTRQYSTCMMDDQLVEIDTRKFDVSRRFSVAKDKEGPLPVAAASHDEHEGHVGGAVPKPVVDPAEVGYTGMKHEMTPATCSPAWAQPSADGRKIFVACNKADQILEVDRDKWAITRRLPTGRGVYNLAVTPDGKLLLATLKQGSLFEVFDIASGKSLARLKTSTTLAHGVAVSPDSGYAFVSSEGVGAAPGKVDVFDLRALVRSGTVDVGQQASGIAFWKMK
jgi:DNA-binding beta-propeller fold protein YncE